MLDCKENIDKNLFYFHNKASTGQVWVKVGIFFKLILEIFCLFFTIDVFGSEIKALADDNILSGLDISLSWQKRAPFLRKVNTHSQFKNPRRHVTFTPCVCYECVVWRETETRRRVAPAPAPHLWTLNMSSRGGTDFLGLNPSPTR